MNDYISRQAAIDAVMDTEPIALRDGDNKIFTVQSTSDVVDALEALPSAQPERKKGRWIDKTSGYAFNYECSNCGYTVHYQFIDEYNFCPNCGAKMDGERKE